MNVEGPCDGADGIALEHDPITANCEKAEKSAVQHKIFVDAVFPAAQMNDVEHICPAQKPAQLEVSLNV